MGGDSGDGDAAVSLRVLCHVHFRSRPMLAAKIRQHSLKKSRKCAELAAQLLEQSALPLPGEAGASGGADTGELDVLRAQVAALQQEIGFLRRKAEGLERENARLGTRAAYGTKSKSTLVSRVVFLEAALVKERHERAAMEEALTEAYSNTLREVMAQEEVRPGKRR